MPFPLVFAAIAAAAAALTGVKKGADAVRDNRSAQEKLDRAEEIYDQAKAQLEAERENTKSLLENLGRVKLETWDAAFGRFVTLMKQVRNVELTGGAAVDGTLPKFTQQELTTMQTAAINAGDIVRGGVMGLTSGALVGVAAYGGTALFASASTGTAITALSGAAATNATLAWLGGGTLAAGGLGVAGGAAVLGGMVAAPVLLVGGFVLAAKAKENLARARSALAEARKAAEEMESAKSVVHAIGEVAQAYSSLIGDVSNRFYPMLDRLQLAIEEARAQTPWWRKFLARLGFKGQAEPKYSRMTEAQRRTVHLAVQGAQVLKMLLEAPLLKEDGAPDPRSAELLERGEQFLLTAG